MNNRTCFLRKKKRVFFTLAISAFTLFIFASCETGEDGGNGGGIVPGGKIPALAMPDVASELAGQAYNIPENSAVLTKTPENAREILFPIIRLLGDKHDEMDDQIFDKIKREVESKIRLESLTEASFSYDSAVAADATVFNSAGLAREGVSVISGAVAGSTKVKLKEAGNYRNPPSGIFEISDIDLEYSYDSDLDLDDDAAKILKAGEFIKGKIWAKGSSVKQWNDTNRSESEEESMAVVFAIAFNRDGYCGKIAAELGYAYKETEIRDRDGYEYGPTVRAKFTFYDNDGNSLGEFEVTDEKDRRRIFNFWGD